MEIGVTRSYDSVHDVFTKRTHNIMKWVSNIVIIIIHTLSYTPSISVIKKF